MIRTRIKDALRASIDTEDESLARRTPVQATRRKASVKASTKRMAAAAAPTEPVTAAKPIDLVLSVDEAEVIKQVRSRLRDTGHALGKAEVLRVAVRLLEGADQKTLDDLAKALPAIKPPKP